MVAPRKTVPAVAIEPLYKALESLYCSAMEAGIFIIKDMFEITVYDQFGGDYQFDVEWDEDAENYRVVLP